MWERGFATIGLLILSNVFMTLAWYGHLRAQPAQNLSFKAWVLVVLGSWGLAFFEYVLQVPANRIGYRGFGGPFSLVDPQSDSGSHSAPGFCADSKSFIPGGGTGTQALCSTGPGDSGGMAICVMPGVESGVWEGP